MSKWKWFVLGLGILGIVAICVAAVNSLKTYESIAIWLEGIALILIFVWDRLDSRKQHEETLAQLKVSQKQADALVSSERAWVIAELVPIFAQFGNQWHRPAGNGWALMSREEVLKGDHLRHKLKLTNMGRTPAHILEYQIGYSREVDKMETGYRMVDTVKRPEIKFDRLLGGNDSVEIKVVDVAEYIRDSFSFEAISHSGATGIFSGSVKYQHVFSDTDLVEVPFVYLYVPEAQQLRRVPLSRTKKAKENENVGAK